MSIYAGLVGAIRKFDISGDSPDHFRVRPFAEHLMDDSSARVHQPAEPEVEGDCWIDTVAHSIGSDERHPPSHQFPATAATNVAHRPEQALQQTECAYASTPAPAQHSATASAWHECYDRSLGNIQDHVHAVAGAVAMLDAVEHKLIAIKCELQRIRDAGLTIDGEKVLAALQSLSDYVNHAIGSVDDQCVNMLRDAKLEIRFAELEARNGQSDGVSLTMISVERLLDFKIKSALAEGIVAQETPEFVDDICAIVSSNIQVLTSVMLALFASRDYTQAVTKLAARESIIPSIDNESPPPQVSSGTIDRLQFDSIDQPNTPNDELQQGRASLTELLKNVREQRTDTGAQFY